MEVSPSEANKKKAIKATKNEKEDKVMHLTSRSVKKVIEIENP
jgi:uncharacterized protein (UPF0254 family)